MPQSFGQGKPALGVIYDSDFGASADSVLALALLHGFDGKREARIVSLSTSKSNLKSAQFCDAIEKFYASATTGLAAIFFAPAAIGMPVDGRLREDTPILVKTAYTPRIQKPNDTADVATLIRNALTAQYDQNAVIVLAGPATNLVRVLDLPGTKELVAKKVKFVSAALDAEADPAAAKRLLAEWPCPVMLVDREIGNEIRYPGASIETDYAYSAEHPVAAAYRAGGAMPYDSPAWAMAAALYAVKPKEGYFRVADKRVLYDAGQKERVVKIYIEMASAKPVPRAVRRQAAAVEKKE